MILEYKNGGWTKNRVTSPEFQLSADEEVVTKRKTMVNHSSKLSAEVPMFAVL